MSRKHLLSSLLADELTAVNSGQAQQSARPALSHRGAVGAMSRALDQASAQQDARIKELETRLESGEGIVELSADLLDPSIVPDRLEADAESHNTLVMQIRENGQQVPVLVRPHPERTGRYQIAYGHRRVRALAELDRPVRAVVKPLTDAELVVAQGQENTSRRDLSFIERAQFAARLEGLGLARETIATALSVDKTELSRLISVARSVPPDLIAAIGPAPKAGRPRWIALAKLVGSSPAGALSQIVHGDGFRTKPSDDRFAHVFAALTSRPSGKTAIEPSRSLLIGGRQVGSISCVRKRTIIDLDNTEIDGFGEYLVSRLDELLAEYRSHGVKK